MSLQKYFYILQEMGGRDFDKEILKNDLTYLQCNKR